MTIDQSSSPRSVRSQGPVVPIRASARPDRQTAEFLPAALELLVTPPSPVATWLTGLISAIIFAALAWSYFGVLDIHAVAPGKIQPSGRSKIVQPMEPGKVAAVAVENGSRVHADDVLVELDRTEAGAERTALARDLESAHGEIARRKAAIAAAGQRVSLIADELSPNAMSSAVRGREAAALAAELAQLKSALNALDAQIDERGATRKRLMASMDERQRLIELSRERVVMRRQLDGKGVGSRAQTIEAEQELERELTTDVGEGGQLLENDAAVLTLRSKMQQAVSDFVSDQTSKLVDAERKADHLAQDLIRAQAKARRTVLTAPIDGTVQQLAVTTVGQVVTTGQALMVVVPSGGAIEVETAVSNQDIGFIRVGQAAVIKVEAFPFTRFGTIAAEVVRIAHDAVDDRDLTSDAASAARAEPQRSSTTARSQSLVFPVTLKLARTSISVDGQDIPLSPGMAVAAEIKTGERRVIDFVLSPLREMTAQSAHER